MPAPRESLEYQSPHSRTSARFRFYPDGISAGRRIVAEALLPQSMAHQNLRILAAPLFRLRRRSAVVENRDVRAKGQSERDDENRVEGLLKIVEHC